MIRVPCTFTTALLLGVAAGCGGVVSIDAVPIGARIEVTRLDGGVVRGLLTARDERAWHISAGSSVRAIRRDQITDVQRMDGQAAPRLTRDARFREVTLPEGTRLAARLRTSIGSDTSLVNDLVEATLTAAVLVDDVEVLPKGSLVTGIVTSADPLSKRIGARLAVWFRKAWVRDRDETYALFASVRHTKAGADVRFTRGSVLTIELDQDIDVRVPIRGAPR